MNQNKQEFYINDDDLGMNDGYCYLYLDKPFTGIAIIKVQGKFVSEIPYRDGTQYGPTRFWDFEEGYLEQKTYYSGSSIHGIDEQWYENGIRKSLQLFEHGVCCKGITWNQFGEIVEIFEIVSEDDNFELLQKYRKLYPEELDLSAKENKYQEN